MPEIKEKGHDISIENMIIHQVSKEMRKDNVVLNCANKVIEISKKEKFFIADVKKSFSRAGLTYGIFEEQNASTVFENLLEKYINKETEFLQFTLDLMDYYKRVLQSEINATGSFLVFAEYTNTTNSNIYLLVLAINNKESYLFNEDLTLSAIQSIDLSQIDVASLINITKWKSFKESADDVNTYLSFRSGLKNLSLYFLKFVGCKDKTTKTIGTNKLVNALKDFLDSKELEKEDREKRLNQIYSYCIDSDRAGRGVFLSDISRLLDEENPNEFQEFASDEKYSVNDLISIDKNRVRLLTRTKFVSKNKDFILEFENILLGKKIKFNEKSNSLTIKDLSPELVAQIKDNM